jgi:hypothetical protein
MNGPITRRATRMLAVSALALAAAGAATGGAQAASVRPQLGTGCLPASRTLTGNSASVVATFTETCNEPGGVVIHDFPVSLSELVNGTWVVVASGEGVAAHECVGTAVHEYTSGGLNGTYACG